MTDKGQYRKDYERYLKIKDKIKNRDDRSFLINFLLEEGRKALEKENEELKAQIKKMKCCHNCKNCEINFTNDSDIKYGCKKLRHKSDDCILNDYHCWELVE